MRLKAFLVDSVVQPGAVAKECPGSWPYIGHEHDGGGVADAAWPMASALTARAATARRETGRLSIRAGPRAARRCWSAGWPGRPAARRRRTAPGSSRSRSDAEAP